MKQFLGNSRKKISICILLYIIVFMKWWRTCCFSFLLPQAVQCSGQQMVTVCPFLSSCCNRSDWVSLWHWLYMPPSLSKLTHLKKTLSSLCFSHTVHSFSHFNFACDPLFHLQCILFYSSFSAYFYISSTSVSPSCLFTCSKSWCLLYYSLYTYVSSCSVS